MDLFDFASCLSDEQQALLASVRRFVANDVLPHIGHWFSEGTFPRELIGTMAELGLFGIDLPTEYGGAGGSALDYGLAMMELEYGDTGLRSFASVQSSLVMYPIFCFGSAEQKAELLPRLASGDLIGCFGLTEPGQGSDPGGMKTTAKSSDGGYVLNGSKLWITNGEIADVALIWAKLDGVVRGFVVDTNTPGLSARPIPRKMSLRASITSELVLEDVEVPTSSMLPDALGLRGPLSCLHKARFGIAWGAIGAMRACFDEALDYSQNRHQFGRPIGGFQLTQDKLVNMRAEIDKALFLTLRTAELIAEGRDKPHHVSMVKRNNVAAALSAARTARTILGANGITADYAAIRHALNLESVLTYEGTHEIHTLIIGAHLTKIPAFS